jgi:hypothetical protein
MYSSQLGSGGLARSTLGSGAVDGRRRPSGILKALIDHGNPDSRLEINTVWMFNSRRST